MLNSSNRSRTFQNSNADPCTTLAREAEQARRTAEKVKAELDARLAAALAHRHRTGPRFSPGSSMR